MKGFFKNKWLNLAYIIICILIIVAYYCSIIFGWTKSEKEEKISVKTELSTEDSVKVKASFEDIWESSLTMEEDDL
jgi:hypothetical protein